MPWLDMYCGCFSCGRKGLSYRIHSNNCGGRIQISEKGIVKCSECGTSGTVTGMIKKLRSDNTHFFPLHHTTSLPHHTTPHPTPHTTSKHIKKTTYEKNGDGLAASANQEKQTGGVLRESFKGCSHVQSRHS